ncbi:MAG: hypothetical protein MUE55_01575 [Thermoplasmata archaeon]|nr:hypothetical protein [Thermoplasmata archaeon]
MAGRHERRASVTYYHAGDVIVAGDGTLIFRDAVFQLVQDFDNQRTVYVDGDATLRFENSVIDSGLAISFIVQGAATLEIIGSEMTGVNIVAKESATVILDGSTMDGTITTSWDSLASIEVYDTELTQAPILSGSSVGHFTNTSVPSITVEDSAVALIYRWIHVTVFDGAGNPLPSATATARFLINGTYWSSATSDSAGVARVNSLGTIITSSGSTFVGNYKINVTYVYDSVPYYASDEVDVGVMPYTEPLGMNATYTSLTVEDALPDLFIDVVGAVTTDPVSPRKGEDTVVTATVQNIGISWAYDVTVDFFDDGVQFGQAIVPLLAPGETVDVTATWSADYPLSPSQHNISVTIDAMDSVLELNDEFAIGYVFVTVMSLPDLQLTSTNIYTDPAAPVIDTPCDLMATVYNLGDTPAYDVTVEFYNGSVSPASLINTTTIGQILVGGYGVASVVWTPESVMQHTIFVVVNYPAEFEETSYTNNNASASIAVFDHPDLVIQGMSFSTGDHVGGGMPVEVLAQIINIEPATVVDPVVYMYVDSMASDPYATTIVYGTVTSSTTSLIVSFIYDAPIVDDDTDVEIFLVVNPDHDPVEQDYTNNMVSSTITVTDIRPDVALSTGDVYVLKGATDVVNGTFGDQVTIYVELYNLGPTETGDITVEVGISGEGVNYTISLALTNVSGATVVNGHQTVMVSWTVNITEGGQYAIWAMADVYGNCSEQSEVNNFASAEFEVLNLAVDILVSVSDSDLKAGDSVAVTVQITQQGTGANVIGLPGVNITLRNEDGDVVAGLADEFTTNEMGVVTVTINVPTGLESGEYVVRVSVLGYDQDSAPITIGGVTARGIPLLVWIIVIGAIVAVVAGFTIYTYVYGLGKMVECGECGAFIPAASKRCPKCGVEFEVGTMKCSECGAWVPAESTECPNCGVKFVGEELGEEDYLEKKKKEYDEMVSKYRELAKSELGKKFSDKKFEEWWKGQPTYITFDDWLAKEEEKAKEGPVPCPVCGSLNPKEATVCHKCGTVFTGDKEAPPRSPPQIPPVQPSLVTEGAPPESAPSDVPQAAPGTAPRMVIRRPIDRKVVPKKIIKTPTNGEGGEQNEGGQ